MLAFRRGLRRAPCASPRRPAPEKLRAHGKITPRSSLIWLPVALPFPRRQLYLVFPYPPPLTHTLAILLALGTSVAAFVLVRRLDGVGYEIAWRPGFGWNFGLHFTILAAIAIYVGMRIGFLVFSPSLSRLRSFPLTALGILFFTAWPEEFLFRGLLQNLLSKTLKNEWAWR